MTNFPNTPIVVQFLATSLARYMELSLLNRQRWSKLRVANFISSSQEIDGQISDTTLGRFLDPKHPQKPSDATVSMVAQFLLQNRAISARQIELAHKSSSYWKANIVTDMFDTPSTESYREFLYDVSGRYAAMSIKRDLLLLSEIIIEYVISANALVINEIISLYQIGNMDALRQKTSNFDPMFAAVLEQYLPDAKPRLNETFVSTGFVSATPDIMAFFHRPSGRGFASIFNVDSLLFTKNEKIVGFRGKRNIGWQTQEVGKFNAAIDNTSSSSPLRTLKNMSIELIYSKIYFEKIQKLRTIDKGTLTPDGDKIRDFYFDIPKTMPVEKGKTKPSPDDRDPDKRLIEAFVTHDIGAFVNALNDGANPNLIPSNYSDPMIFPLAQDGEFEWVSALINSGRCDLTIVDKNGFPPSHAPAVITRKISQTSEPSMTLSRFAQTAKLLQEHEIRQLRDADVYPSPDA